MTPTIHWSSAQITRLGPVKLFCMHSLLNNIIAITYLWMYKHHFWDTNTVTWINTSALLTKWFFRPFRTHKQKKALEKDFGKPFKYLICSSTFHYIPLPMTVNSCYTAHMGWFILHKTLKRQTTKKCSESLHRGTLKRQLWGQRSQWHLIHSTHTWRHLMDQLHTCWHARIPKHTHSQTHRHTHTECTNINKTTKQREMNLGISMSHHECKQGKEEGQDSHQEIGQW